MSIEFMLMLCYVNQYGDILILDAHWSIRSYAMHMQLCHFMCDRLYCFLLQKTRKHFRTVSRP